MGYRFSRNGKSLPDDLRRITREQIAASIKVSDDAESDPQALHELRKTVKHLRALVKLFGSSLAHGRAIDRRLRDAGRLIRDLRDADVQTALFDQLVAGASPPLADSAALRDAFCATLTRSHIDRATALASHRKMLLRIADDISAWKVAKRADGFDCLKGGLKSTWADCRRMMKPALRHPKGRTLHEWRKRVKDQGYQARLLQPIRPDKMKQHCLMVADLGEMLGDARDFALFAEQIDALPGGAALATLSRQHETEILGTAGPLARRIFKENAAELTRQWGKWWSRWKQKPRRKRAA